MCLKSQFILNGVCVIWRGYIDLNRLDGVGYVEFDAQRAKVRKNIVSKLAYLGDNIHRLEVPSLG